LKRSDFIVPVNYLAILNLKPKPIRESLTVFIAVSDSLFDYKNMGVTNEQ